MTLIGNRPEWVYAMVACWRLGAVALPCTEQLRPADLRARIEQVEPRAFVADERDARARWREAGFDGPVLAVPDERLYEADAGARRGARRRGPGADRVHLGHGRASPSRSATAQRYLAGQRVQAEHWFGARAGDLCWCTAASGWSQVGPQRLRGAPGCAAPRRCSTTPASTRPSGSRCSSARA